MALPAGTTTAAGYFVAIQAALIWIKYLFGRGVPATPPAPAATAPDIGAACPLEAEASGSWSPLAVGLLAPLAFLAGVGVAAIGIAVLCWLSGLGAVLLAGVTSRYRSSQRPLDSPLAVIAPYDSDSG